MYEKENISPLAMELLLRLARTPGRELFLRELAREVQRSASGCQKALAALHRLGMVERRQSGRNQYYKASDHPAVRYFKIFSTILELGGLVSSLRHLAAKVVLFGSAASGEDTKQSDLDLLVVGDKMVGTRRVLNTTGLKRPVRPVVMTPGELLRLKRRNRSFFDEMARGIVLWDRSRADERLRGLPEGPPAGQDDAR